jgi:protoporphyrinogen/coproporphyrinogen III oxidase
MTINQGIRTMAEQDVIIIGAGVSGLAAAHFLTGVSPESSILILEKDARPGGAVRSFSQEGFLAEWGPHGFLDNTAESRELLADTGLHQEMQRAPLGEFARFVCRRGKLVQLPQNPQSLLSTPLLSLGGKLRLLADLWRRPVTEEQTIGQWASHRFGRGVLPLVDAAVTGTFAGDYERLSIDAVMPGVRTLELRHGSVLRGLIKKKKEAKSERKGLPAMISFPQGLERLAEKLADGRDIRLLSAVTAISFENGGWRVDAGDHSYRAAALIVALGVNQALPLLAPLSTPPVPAIPEARIANVVLGFSGEAKIPKAFGYLAPEAEKRFTMGALFSSRMFPGRAPAGMVLLEALVGGRRHPERLALADEEMIREVVADLRQLLPLPADPLFSKVLRPPMGIPQLEIGYSALLGWRRELQKKMPGLAICGFGWEGIGINDMVKAAKEAARTVAGSKQPTAEAAVKPVYF